MDKFVQEIMKRSKNVALTGNYPDSMILQRYPNVHDVIMDGSRRLLKTITGQNNIKFEANSASPGYIQVNANATKPLSVVGDIDINVAFTSEVGFISYDVEYSMTDESTIIVIPLVFMVENGKYAAMCDSVSDLVITLKHPDHVDVTAIAVPFLEV